MTSQQPFVVIETTATTKSSGEDIIKTLFETFEEVLDFLAIYTDADTLTVSYQRDIGQFDRVHTVVVTWGVGKTREFEVVQMKGPAR